MNAEQVMCERTKKGYAAISEYGGGCCNTGDARIVADCNGGKKTSLVPGMGYSNEQHGLFIMKKGDILIKVSRWHDDLTITIFQLDTPPETGNEIDVTRILRFSCGEWDIEPPEKWGPAIQAAVEKTRHYHCRRMYWGNEPKPKY